MIRKGIKRDFLILLGYLIDELDAWSFHNQMRRWMFDGWYKRSSVGPTVSRLLSVGEIEKIEKGGKKYYRLTSKGSRRIREDIPLFKLASKPWDERWRIVIFDIKEEKKFQREALRDKLLSLGFGKWQRSVYITPHDIEQEVNQYLVSKNLFPSCVCLVARRSDLGDDKAVANRVWKLDQLNEEYEDFIYKCDQLIKKEEGKVDLKEVRELWHQYKGLILNDPYLPKQLLPKDWLAEKARKEFVKFCSKMTRSQPVRAKKKKVYEEKKK